MDNLALQIGEINNVKIYYAYATDSGSRQIRIGPVDQWSTWGTQMPSFAPDRPRGFSPARGHGR